MQLSAPFYAANRLVSRWHDAIVDPARRERTVLASLLIYVLLWTAYGTIAKSSQGLHPDMTEIVAWSRDLSLGYLKHPPFAAWLVWLWFSVFPLTEWFTICWQCLCRGSHCGSSGEYRRIISMLKSVSL